MIVNGRNLNFDLSNQSRIRLSNIEALNLAGSGPNTLKMTYDDLLATTDSNHVLTVITDTDDTVTVGAGWRIDSTITENGKFARVLKQGTATLKMFGPRDWTNPINALDTNASGSVSPVDALLIINELNRPLFSINRQLADPVTLAKFPGSYFDTNSDGLVAPLDVLLVINFLNARAVTGEGEASTQDSAGAAYAVATSANRLLQESAPTWSYEITNLSKQSLICGETWIVSNFPSENSKYSLYSLHELLALEEKRRNSNASFEKQPELMSVFFVYARLVTRSRNN